jgi:hypothetical protein
VKSKVLRQESAQRCKQLARAARGRSGVTLDEVAGTLEVSLRQAQRLFEDGYGQLSYADLVLLARAPETSGLCRELLAPLLEMVDRRSLRLADLEGMASTSTTAQTALEILRPTVERLESLTLQQRTDTRGVAE